LHGIQGDNLVKIARLIGAAGSGKTTELLRIMEGALPKLGGNPLQLGFASFTRAARAEAVGRAAAAWNVPPSLLDGEGWFRTVHSTARRCLALEPGQLIGNAVADTEWISNALGVKVSTSIDEDTGRQKFVGGQEGAALTCWERARNTLQPLDEVVRKMRRLDDEVPDYAAVVRIAERYEMAKRLEDRLDFSDLLLRFAGYRLHAVDGVERTEPEGTLPNVSAWLFDEQQDASPLLDAACKRLVSAESVKWCYVVGDPFQCQPAGTPVLTASGYKPIEDLDPERDWLIAYNKKDGRFYGTGGGTRFQKASRVVDSGLLIEVTFSDGTKSVCTTNHKWLVRTNRGNVYATYLMRKGSRWRIGTVQMFANGSAATSAKNGDFRLKMRMNQEDADAVWVLRTFGSDREARLYEQIASFKYGIPQVTFRPPHGKAYLDREFIDAVFHALGDLSTNADRCLSDHGLDGMFPFCSKADRSKNGSKACRFLHAANLLPGVHVVPKLLDGYFDRAARGSGDRRGHRSVGKTVEWVGVAAVRRLEPGEAVRVYSLEVEKHHTYVTTNGVVTGNCIFGFAGSSAECFLGWPAEKERTMPKSYRCPKPILELGERCLRRMYRGYFDRKVAPADHEGQIFDCETELPFIRARPDEEWLFIARTNYEANRLYASLHAAGKPAKWVTQQEGATARGTGLAALYALEKGKHVSGKEWSRAIELLPCTNKDKEPMLARGVKTGWAKKHADEWDVIFSDDLTKVGATEPLMEKIRSGRWCGLVDRGEEWRRHAERWGPELVANTKIRVGTIHSVKGMEADNVAMLTTVGKRVEQGREDDRDQHDEECRIAYVGVTRARRNLYIVNEGRHGKPVPRMEVL
jgi:superfamily I DNA/RNA helicase